MRTTRRKLSPTERARLVGYMRDLRTNGVTKATTPEENAAVLDGLDLLARLRPGEFETLYAQASA